MRAWLANEKDGAAADAIEASELEVGRTRTRCVATMLSGGHADNALAQSATAVVNCRIMPGVPPSETLAELKSMVGPRIEVARMDGFVGVPSPPSPLRPDVLGAVKTAVGKIYGPNMEVCPIMSTGASDGSFFRSAGMPVYDIDGS
jgi:acetylornithine deacetylase/succinyl-diaminopimelate desuccinylase-like protein